MSINKATSRIDYPIRCKYYSKTYVDKMKLVKDAKVKGVFYCRDIGSFKTESIIEGPVKYKQVSGTIETKDFVTNLEEDDFISYGGYLWLVESSDADDDNPSKKRMSRPPTTTQLKIRR